MSTTAHTLSSASRCGRADGDAVIDGELENDTTDGEGDSDGVRDFVCDRVAVNDDAALTASSVTTANAKRNHLRCILMLLTLQSDPSCC